MAAGLIFAGFRDCDPGHEISAQAFFWRLPGRLLADVASGLAGCSDLLL